VTNPLTIEDPQAKKIEDALDQITDFYLPSSNAMDGFFYPKASKIRNYPFLYEFVSELLEGCHQRLRPDSDEFVVRVRGRSFRGHKIDTIEQPYFALRRMPKTVPSLESLGLDPAVRQVLLHESLSKGGLVLICGETGQGKSTTCAAAIKERLFKFGAFCLTVEDPPEMPLHGEHGDGRCLQTEVSNGEFDEALRGAMRCYPTSNGSILYVGETRGAETAAEVLRAAMNGALVFTTTHAPDVPSGLRRIMSFASARLGQEEAQVIMGSTFRLGLHQTLESARPLPGQPTRRRLSMSFLMSGNGKTPVANIIRKGEIDALGTSIQQQAAMMRNQGPNALLRDFQH
jgi:twitching motility protein PilT